MKQVVHEHFDSESAAKIFEDEQGTDWLADLIKHAEWRQLVYDLSEEHPNSLMLNYLIKLISDAGFQSEIAQISTIANHLDVFSGVLADYIASCINQNEFQLKENIGRVTAIACKSQHTYLYCQVLLHSMQNGPMAPLLQRLSEEVHLACESIGEAAKTEFLFLGADALHHRVSQSVTGVLEAGKITHHMRTIHEVYSNPDQQPPTLELLRFPGFLDLVVDELFRPEQRLRADMVDQCTFLVAYAVSCDGGDPSPSSEFQQTLRALREVLVALERVEVGSMSASVTAVLYDYIAYPVVARGLLKFLGDSLNKSDFFSDTFTTKNLPPHFALLDEIGTRHVLLRDKLLALLALLFECSYSIDSMLAIDLKRKILDRVVYLFALGHAIPVLICIRSLCGRSDLSLIVYFVNQMVSMVGPPYSVEFFRAAFPIFDRGDVKAGFANKVAERVAVTAFLRAASAQLEPEFSGEEAAVVTACVSTYSKGAAGRR